jgi:hypothetical protein
VQNQLSFGLTDVGNRLVGKPLRTGLTVTWLCKNTKYVKYMWLSLMSYARACNLSAGVGL